MSGRDAFLERFGSAFELSPWVAEAAWEEGPFESAVDAHAAMLRAVERAPAARRLELIRAHPELGGAATIERLTPESSAEQRRLDGMGAELAQRLDRAVAAYRERFGFPFVICVRDHSAEGIVAEAERRLEGSPEEEERTALREIGRIAAHRMGVADGIPGVEYRIAYGKAGVPVYRHGAPALSGIPEVPESRFSGRSNALLANEISVEVHGDNFLPAYTRGDNSEVVATDSMKNFILSQAAEHEGATLEGYLARLGSGFIERYDQMQEVVVSGRELPFSVPEVPGDGGFEPSPVLRQRQWSDRSVAELRYRRGEGLVALSAGRMEMELLKTEGSAFTRFVRDEYTTLPERADRPLFIRLDVHWTYSDPADAVGEDHSRYVAGEQVRDVCAVVFHELVSESIQQLLHEMGRRLFERYPQVDSLEMVGRNMTRDPYDDERRVFVPPFPAEGTIELAMRR